LKATIPTTRLRSHDRDALIEHFLALEADDRRLRDHYSIDAGDQELREDNLSYATLVPDEAGTAKRVEDPSSLETPDPDKRTDDTYERLKDAGPAETRDVDAGEIANELTTNQASSDDGAGEKQSERGAGNEGEEGGEDTHESRPADEPAAAPDAKRERSGG